jgi:hypothetical protein
MPFTRIWPPVTDLASGRSRYVVQISFYFEACLTCLQILKVVELEKTDDVRRPYIKQLLVKGLKFPLPHRINKKAGKKVFASKRPSTFF